MDIMGALDELVSVSHRHERAGPDAALEAMARNQANEAALSIEELDAKDEAEVRLFKQQQQKQTRRWEGFNDSQAMSEDLDYQ